MREPLDDFAKLEQHVKLIVSSTSHGIPGMTRLQTTTRMVGMTAQDRTMIDTYARCKSDVEVLQMKYETGYFSDSSIF
jgi:hypothetical protein